MSFAICNRINNQYTYNLNDMIWAIQIVFQSSIYLLCRLAFGLVFFLFGLFTVCSWGTVSWARVGLSRCRDVRLLLTVPVEVLLSLRVIEVLLMTSVRETHYLNCFGSNKWHKCTVFGNIFNSYSKTRGNILGCWDRSTGRSVDHNSNLKTHHTGMWRCQELLLIQKEGTYETEHAS